MADESDKGTKIESGFSRDYVEELRKENASWRTKYQDLKSASEVSQELARCNVKADPSWVKVQEGQSVQDAVRQLMEAHPHLVATQAVDQTNTDVQPSRLQQIKSRSPKPVANADPKSTTPTQSTSQILKDRNFEEIKKDPVARKALRDYYRELLLVTSNRKIPD